MEKSSPVGLAPLTAGDVAGLAPANMFDLAGRVALVTGGTGGVGQWLAGGLGAAGARVAVSDRAETSPRRTVEVLEAAGIDAHAFDADLTDPGGPEGLVAAVTRELGGPDILVNCAAINQRQPIAEADRSAFDEIVDVNLRAPYFLAQASALAMRERGGGAIVNIGSINSALGIHGVSAYGATKAALSQVTRVMAVEWSDWNIRANCLAPGFLMTPLTKALWEDDTRSRWLLNRVPMRRPGTPSEMVGLCVLLASDAGSFMTGQTVYVDGGLLAGSGWHRPDE